MSSAVRNKKGLIIGASYTNDEVRRPIMTKVVVEKVESLPGSIAGAGSGDFHQYRNLRRREEARQDLMELEYRERQIAEEFQALREYNKNLSDQKSLKKAIKRKRKKAKIQTIKAIKKEAETLNQFENDGSFLEAIKKRKIDDN